MATSGAVVVARAEPLAARRARPGVGRTVWWFVRKKPLGAIGGLIMAAIYRTLLEEIERGGFDVLRQRTSLTPLRKLWIAWRTWIAA